MKVDLTEQMRVCGFVQGYMASAFVYAKTASAQFTFSE